MAQKTAHNDMKNTAAEHFTARKSHLKRNELFMPVSLFLLRI